MRTNRLLVIPALMFITPALMAQTAANVVRGQEITTPVVSVTFEGGSLTSYVAALRDAVGASYRNLPANIIVRGDAGAAKVPPISVEGVSLRAALEVAVRRERERTVLADGTVVERAHNLDVIDGGPSSAPIYLIDLWEQRSRAPSKMLAPPSRETIEVYTLDPASLAGPTGAELISTDATLMAIDAALALDRSDTGPELKFHDDSGLLIARGTPGQHDAIAAVLKNLTRNAEMRYHSALAAAERIEDLRRQVVTQRANLTKLVAKLDLAEQRRHEAAELAAAGTVSTREVHEADAERQILMAELDAAKQIIDSLEEELDAAEQLASGAGEEQSARAYGLKAFGDKAGSAEDVLRALCSVCGAGFEVDGDRIIIRAPESVHDQAAEVIRGMGDLAGVRRSSGGGRGR